MIAATVTAPLVIATIPSPSSGSLDIGPLSLNAYGLMIALGVVAAVWLFGRRLESAGVGTRDDASAVALWAVPAGVIGARIYHVVTDWDRFRDDLAEIPQIWHGGLGIPGGLVAGIAAGIWAGRRRGIATPHLTTAAAPAIPLAQAIGRWGNWFNQELFGRPTDLPWALEVSDAKALGAGYPGGTTFHPTFLYESLWNLALCGLLLWIDRRFRPRPGRLMAMYLVGYGVGRFWVERLRIDPAHDVGGLRWNQWVALAVVVLAGGYLLAARRAPLAEPAAVGVDGATVTGDDGGAGDSGAGGSPGAPLDDLLSSDGDDLDGASEPLDAEPDEVPSGHDRSDE